VSERQQPNDFHGFTHRRAPDGWQEGLPLGNGELGVMLWGDGAPVCLTLDHADLWDLRCVDELEADPHYNYAELRRLVAEGRWNEVMSALAARQEELNPVGPTKISMGRAEFALGAAESYQVSLDIDRAVASGTLWTSKGEHDLTTFVSKCRNVVCLRVTDAPEHADLRFIPLAEMTEGLAKLGHPTPVLRDEPGLHILVQVIPEGPAYALAWNVSGPEYLLAVELADTPEEAERLARDTWQAAHDAGFDTLLAEHTAAWREYWSASAVYLPEPELEFMWYYGLYLLGSSAKRGHRPPGLQAVWAMDGVMPPWRGDYHADMNVQETFWPAGATGHLDLLDSWVDEMQASLPQAQDFTRRFFGTEGSFWPCSLLPQYTLVPCWHTVQFAWSNSGWLAWLVWLRWRYSQDTAWLAETGYPLVAEIFKFYRDNLEADAEGRLHIPLSSSPEYKENSAEGWCSDPNVDIALIRRTCDWLSEMEQALGISELTASAHDIHERLAPYALMKMDTPIASSFAREKILGLSPGKPLTESHRHPSHLMAIHPAMDLTVEGTDEERQIIADSLEHYLELGQYRWAGHTYGQWISFAACIGRPGMAYDALRTLHDTWLAANGLHFNSDFRFSGRSSFSRPLASAPFTMEASNAATMGICDLLVQGWNDRLRIFPAVPDAWHNVAFVDLMAEGAWRVSGVYRDQRTVWVKATAGVQRQLRLKDPFAGAACTIEGAELTREGEDYVGMLNAGQTVTLSLPGQALTPQEALPFIRAEEVRTLGLR
jgi:alpha-L-fucosidase 2